jgi:hypothetical protein
MKLRFRWSLSTLMMIVAVAGIVTWIKAPEWSRAYRVWLADRAVRDTLAGPISLTYPDGVSLEDLMVDIYRQTRSASFPRGLPVYFDHEGLQHNDVTLVSTIKIDSRGAPLGRSLEHALGQVRLVYKVQAGVVRITSKDLASP